MARSVLGAFIVGLKEFATMRSKGLQSWVAGVDLERPKKGSHVEKSRGKINPCVHARTTNVKIGRVQARFSAFLVLIFGFPVAFFEITFTVSAFVVFK